MAAAAPPVHGPPLAERIVAQAQASTLIDGHLVDVGLANGKVVATLHGEHSKRFTADLAGVTETQLAQALRAAIRQLEPQIREWLDRPRDGTLF